MRLNNVTPKQFICTFAACQGVYAPENNENKLFIVGKKVDPKEVGISDKVSEDEQIVLVDKEMLRQFFEKKD